MPYRLISVFAIVIASAMLMTSITSAQQSSILPASPGIEIEQPSRILDATTQSDSSLDPLPSSAGKASPPSNQPDTTITESRHRLDALEQPVLQLAEQVRAMEAKQGKDHAESIRLRTELRDLVQKTFAARQEIQRTELAEFSRRLQMMQQTIDARQQSVDRIVERRVEELLDPNLNWTPSQSGFDVSSMPSKPPEPVVVGQVKEISKYDRERLRQTAENLMKDLNEFIDRTPLNILLQLKDEPVQQIASDFRGTVQDLKELIDRNADDQTLRECVSSIDSLSRTLNAKFRTVDSESLRRALEIIQYDVESLAGVVASTAALQTASEWTSRLPKPAVVNRIGQDAQKVTLTLFEVTDANFMKDREINAEPSVAPTDLDEQLSKMTGSKTVKILGTHTIETILNLTATFHSGGTFKVPRRSPTLKGEVEIGNRTRVTQRIVSDQRFFEIMWESHISDFNNAVDGVPPTFARVETAAINSPQTGGPGYLCGPFAVANSSDRRFIHFRLDGTADATPASTEQIGQSQDPLASLQGEWGLEQLTEGGGENEGNDRRVTITKDLLNIYAETGELKTVFQLEVLNDKTVNAVLDPNGERLKLTGILEITAERFQLCLGADGLPPAVMAPGANVIYLSAKRPSDSTPDSTTSGSPAASAEFLKRLQGEWKCKVFKVEGETMSDPDAVPIVRIEGAVASVDLKIRGVDEDYPSSKEPEEREVRIVWLLELVGSGTPQQVNLLVDPNGEKKQQYGIVECTEDRLRICVGAEDAPSELNRPAIFAPGSKVIYLEAQRPTSQPVPLPEGEEQIQNTYLQ